MNNRNHEYFITIAETGNLTAAAKKLFTSQPSLTQYLNRLEASLGIALFNRSRSPLTLTRAGEIYLDYIHQSQYLETSLLKQLNVLKNTTLGNIKVGVPLQLQPLVTNKILLRFVNENPGINITFSDEASLALEKLVAKNLLDAAIIHSEFKNPALKYEKLSEEPIFILCNKNNKLVAGKKSSPENPIIVTASQLEEGNFYLANSSLFLQRKTEQYFRKNGISPKNTATLSSIDAMMNLIPIDENGIALIPQSFYNNSNNKDSVAFISIDGTSITWYLALVYNKSEEASPSLSAFIDFIKHIYESDYFE